MTKHLKFPIFFRMRLQQFTEFHKYWCVSLSGCKKITKKSNNCFGVFAVWWAHKQFDPTILNYSISFVNVISSHHTRFFLFDAWICALACVCLFLSCPYYLHIAISLPPNFIICIFTEEEEMKNNHIKVTCKFIRLENENKE